MSKLTNLQATSDELELMIKGLDSIRRGWVADNRLLKIRILELKRQLKGIK